MFGAEVSRRFGFADALAAEDQGSPGQVLHWAGWVQIPPPLRAIVQVACSESGPAGYFDEVEVAEATCPLVGADSPRLVTLYARRRGGVIHFRLSGGGAATPGSSGSPLGPEAAHALLCGPPAEVVARGVGRILELFEAPSKGAVAAFLAHKEEWLPRAASRFYDFTPIEKAVRREVIEQVLRRNGFTPPWP